jgi:hypothetical protein
MRCGQVVVGMAHSLSCVLAGVLRGFAVGDAHVWRHALLGVLVGAPALAVGTSCGVREWECCACACLVA